ncbi:hypothetical protein ACWDA9_42315, partial [Streptomyces sp. NPDC001193]
VVAEGTPEQVASVGASHTGKFLRDILGAERVSDAASLVAPPKKAPAKRAAAKKTAAPAKKAAAKKATPRARKA